MKKEGQEKDHGRGVLGLHGLGVLSAASYGLLCWQSRDVEPVSLTVFYSSLSIAWLAAGGAFLLVRRQASGGSSQGLLVVALLWATLFRLTGLVANPILGEDDYFRFLWDGYRFAETGDPYEGVPADFWDQSEIPEPMASLPFDINYPELPTIYGPVMELVFLAGYLLGPADLLILKGLFVLFEALLLFLLSRFLSQHWLVLAAWCPLLVFETSFQAHPDVIAVALMFAAYWAAQRRYPFLAMVLLAVATCAKPFAVLLWPFIVQERRWFRQGLLLAAVISLIYLPFLLQRSDAGLTSLGAMATGWEFNAAGYSLLKLIVGEWARLAGLALFALFYCGMLKRFWSQNGEHRPGETPLDLIYGVFFLFSPVINAWYLLWLFPFVMLKPRAWSLMALGAVSLSYSTGLNLGDGSLEEFEIPRWVRSLEFGLVILAAGGGMVAMGRRRRGAPEATE